MEYYNFLTTPSGRYCEVRDITNEEYLVMVKFIESENYKGFFQCLDEFAKKNINDFDSFNIIDKCYIYIAICMYSIRGTITVNNKQLGEQQISLSLILNNIENSYSEKTFTYEIKKGAVLTFGYPSKFIMEDNLPVIDWFSGFKKFNDIEVTDEMREKLKNTLKTKDLMGIEQVAREAFGVECDLFSGVPMNKMLLTLCSESLILNALFFYKYPLQGIYAEMYSCCKHLKMSFNDFMKRSHVETDIFLSFAKKENEEYAKKDSSGMGRMANMIADQ